MRRENPVNDCGKEEIPGDQEAVRFNYPAESSNGRTP